MNYLTIWMLKAFQSNHRIISSSLVLNLDHHMKVHMDLVNLIFSQINLNKILQSLRKRRLEIPEGRQELFVRNKKLKSMGLPFTLNKNGRPGTEKTEPTSDSAVWFDKGKGRFQGDILQLMFMI